MKRLNGPITLLIIGATAIFAAAPWVNVTRVGGAVNAATVAAPAYAIDRLQPLRPLAARYPDAAVAVDRQLVRSCAAAGRFDQAERYAESIRRGGSGEAPQYNLVPQIEAWADWLYNRVTTAAPEDGWSGYEVLVRELRRQGDAERLTDLANRVFQGRNERLWRTATADAAARRGAQPAARRVVSSAPPADSTRPPASTIAPPRRSVEEPAAEAPTSTPPEGRRRWGVVTASDAVIWRGHQRVDDIPAGALVDITELKMKNGDEYAACSIIVGRKRLTGLHIATSAVDMQDGSLREANELERKLRVRRGRLMGTIADLEADPSGGAPPANPHAAALAKAKADIDDYQRKANKLLVEMEKARGGRRTEIMDELRMMRGEEMALKRALAAVQKQSSDWAAANPRKGKSARRELVEARAALTGVNRKLERL